jgi:tetratricopeptide (TPR) repeat protein
LRQTQARRNLCRSCRERGKCGNLLLSKGVLDMAMGKTRWALGWMTVCAALCCWSAEEKSADAKKEDEKPKKVSVLLVEANKLMTDAQDAYVDGDGKKAVELYRKSLAEIERVERENADRAGTAEFAPVRFRKALCETEIDRIILEEASAKARTVTVTDTAELEKKRAERHREAVSNNVPEKTVALASKMADGSKAKPPEMKADEKDDEKSDKTTVVDVPGELEFAKDMLSMDKAGDARDHILKVLKSEPDNREAHYLMAQAQIAQGHPEDAEVVLMDLLEDNPNDESALLLAAGAAFAAGKYPHAMDLLDRALKANPKRPDGYYDMAWVLLEMDPKNLNEPEMYYRQAVKLGGPRDRDLERRLGIKK